MVSFRTALLATAASALSLAATPAALANPLTFTNYTTANGLGSNFMRGVYASGSSIYAATSGGLSIAQLPSTPVPGPLPVAGAATAFGFSRKLRRRLRAAGTVSPCC
jgi:ABC-type phosphate transport system substrate-binding protein